MLDRIHWLGHDAFRIDAQLTIYFDPWKLPADAPAAGLVLITHEHYDHCSPEDVERIAGPDSLVVANRAAAEKLNVAGELRIVEPGDSFSYKGIEIDTLPAYNLNKFREPGVPFHPKTAGHIGYIVTLDGQRIYHAGDTDAIPEMAGLGVDIALLPVSGTYVMTAEEAAGAAQTIAPGIAIPMHYGTIVGSREDAERFAELYEGEVVIMEAGA